MRLLALVPVKFLLSGNEASALLSSPTIKASPLSPVAPSVLWSHSTTCRNGSVSSTHYSLGGSHGPLCKLLHRPRSVPHVGPRYGNVFRRRTSLSRTEEQKDKENMSGSKADDEKKKDEKKDMSGK